MAKYKIVAQGRPNTTGDYKFEMEGLQGLDFQITEVPAVSDDEFLDGAHDADALITRDMPVSQKVIDRLEKCQIIALDSVGTDLVDVPAATAKGIPVTNCPDTFVQEVAEHTAALILAAHRRLLLVDKMVREDRWAEGRPALMPVASTVRTNAGADLLWEYRQGGCAADEAIRSPHPRPRPLRQGDCNRPTRRRAGRVDRVAATVGYHLKPSPGHRRHQKDDRRGTIQADETSGYLR